MLDAYIDTELDAANNLAVEQHLQECAGCLRMYERYRACSAAIRESSLSFQAPPSLQKRVQELLPSLQPARRPIIWPWLSAAALVLLLLGILGVLGFWGFTRLNTSFTGGDRSMMQAAIDSHERSLVDNHLVDILSSDPNTLKMWFEGKLGFCPPVINLPLQGFALIGGRLDILNSRPVAAIVYKRGEHVINLFAWPAAQNADLHTFSLQGYYLTHWTRYGMNCWAVADLDANEMRQFARLIDQHVETFL